MNYKILPQPSPDFLKKYPDFNPVILCILWQRGIRTKKEIDDFLNPVYGQKQYDPFLFREMRDVVKRILKAAFDKERVLVYGDYDADGVCASVLMIETLEKLYGLRAIRRTQDLIQVYLPHREEEGYGLNLKAVEYIKQKKIELLIACDCGSTNIAELQALADSQIDVIIIDHHIAPKKRPPVYGFINPKFEAEAYPFRQLSAGGVVFKVIQALKIDLGEAFEKWALDLVAISTVADVMPLIGENRVLVKWGLVVLNKTRRIGLQALIRAAQIKKQIGTYEIGFMIGPRINAAGRLDHANIAFDLLRQREEVHAKKEAEKLNKTNEYRQKMTELIFKKCAVQIKPQIENKDRILIAYNLKKDKWPVGLIGLAAGRLTDKFNRPAFVISLAEHGLSGSGRSIEEFDVMAGLEQVKNLFSKYGGHSQACGFTFAECQLRLIRQFKQKLENYARQKLKDDDLIPRTQVSVEIKFSDITWGLLRDINRMEPFGAANAKPIFLTKGAKVRSVRVMGLKQDHLKIILEQDKTEQEAVFFRCQERHKQIEHGDVVDIIYNAEINEWHGEKRIQLVLKAVKTLDSPLATSYTQK